MKYLLDTNVVSELIKPRPSQSVASWLSSVEESVVFISVVTIAELRYGVELMPHSSRKERLQRWITQDLRNRFGEKILPVNADVADVWGRLMSLNRASGYEPNPMDACIAAIAEFNKLTVATRNVADFEQLNIQVLNPWSTAV